MERFTKPNFPKTKYLFFTGKGGVGKTSVASSLAYSVASDQKRVLLISTDPASNLQDIFNQPLTNEPSFSMLPFSVWVGSLAATCSTFSEPVAGRITFLELVS